MNQLTWILSATAAAALSASAFAQDTKPFEIVDWEDRPDVAMPYAPAIKVTGGTIVYLAGTTATPVYHSHPHIPEEFDDIPPDMESQTRIVMENIKKSLEAVGADFSDVVSATTYLTDLSQQDDFARVWREYFGDNRPATTTVQVAALATDPRCLIEVKVTAVVAD